MGHRRIAQLAGVAAALVALTALGCTPTAGPSATPSPSAASASPGVDYTAPGAAEAVLRQLVDAAGSRDVLKVELTRTTALLAVVKDESAQTWAIRGGVPAQVDGDTQFIGQARFRVDDFDLRDVGALFREAAGVAGSSAAQELQIVEYNSGVVYMTVTTTPESQTVFFRPDRTLVPTLDYDDATDLRTGLYDATVSLPQVTAIGIGAAGVWSDRVTGDNLLLRRTRPERFPARTDTRNEKPVGPAFDPAVVDARVVQQVMERLRAGRNVQVSVAIDRRDNLRDPIMRFTVDNKTVATDLAGNDVTGTVR